MKLLRGTLQPSGHRIVHLVDPEDLDLLRFEETWETPEGLDFALWWNEAWHEGRCYGGFPERTFVTYGTAQRVPLRHGMQARLPHYTLGPDRLFELASAYVQELGYPADKTRREHWQGLLHCGRRTHRGCRPSSKRAITCDGHHRPLQQWGYSPPCSKRTVSHHTSIRFGGEL